jgi:hypothetical protein
MSMKSPEAADGPSPLAPAYTLVYSSIHGAAGFAFPCDETGIVEMNALSERCRDDYFLARALVGRNFHPPTIVCRPSDPVKEQGLP